MGQICSCCGDRLKNSDHYEVKIARNHDLEEKVDRLQNDKEKKDEEESRKAEEHEKEKKLESYKAELRDLDDDELDEILESLRAEIEDLKDQLKHPTDEEDETKKSKSAMAEYIGVDAYHLVGKDFDTATESLVALQRNRKKKSRHGYDKSYSVLTLDQNHNESKRGDSLLQRMGSVD